MVRHVYVSIYHDYSTFLSYLLWHVYGCLNHPQPRSDDGQSSGAMATSAPSNPGNPAPSTGDPEKDKKIRNLRKVSGIIWIPLMLEHRKLGWKVLILKYDLGKSFSKEMWCKVAHTKKNFWLPMLKDEKCMLYEVNPFYVRWQENDFPS